MAAAPVESCQSLPKRCPWGRLGSVLYTCTRLHRIRRRFKHFLSVSLSRPLHFSSNRLLIYLTPSLRTSRHATPAPRTSFAAARLGLRAPIAAEELGSTATTTRPRPSPLRDHDQGLVTDCDLPEPSPSPFLTGGSVAPLSTAALLSTLEIGLGPSAARPLRRGAGRPIPNTISSGGGLAEGNGSAFNWLSRARRAPSDFPSPVAPPPSCELVAPRGAETRERRPEPGLPSQVRNWSRGVPAPG